MTRITSHRILMVLKFDRVLYERNCFHKRGGDSPLLIASFKCRLEMVKEFVKLSLPATSTQAQRYNFMNQRNAHMCTPLIASMYQNICFLTSANRDSNYDLFPAKQVELVKFLIEKRCRSKFRRNKFLELLEIIRGRLDGNGGKIAKDDRLVQENITNIHL